MFRIVKRRFNRTFIVEAWKEFFYNFDAAIKFHFKKSFIKVAPDIPWNLNSYSWKSTFLSKYLVSHSWKYRNFLNIIFQKYRASHPAHRAATDSITEPTETEIFMFFFLALSLILSQNEFRSLPFLLLNSNCSTSCEHLFRFAKHIFHHVRFAWKQQRIKRHKEKQRIFMGLSDEIRAPRRKVKGCFSDAKIIYDYWIDLLPAFIRDDEGKVEISARRKFPARQLTRYLSSANWAAEIGHYLTVFYGIMHEKMKFEFL